MLLAIIEHTDALIVATYQLIKKWFLTFVSLSYGVASFITSIIVDVVMIITGNTLMLMISSWERCCDIVRYDIQDECTVSIITIIICPQAFIENCKCKTH